jgi:4-hydroxy-tetrahydrodipicolinate synthase
VAEAAPELPLILYNIPSRVVIDMPPDFLSELSSIDNVVAVKQANNEELGPVEGLAVLAGNDDAFLPTLEFGGAGGILVASHLAGERMREMWESAQGGDMERAREIDAGLQPLYEALSVTTNPIPIKAALELRGLIPSGRMRLPLVPADREQRQIVSSALESVGL